MRSLTPFGKLMEAWCGHHQMSRSCSRFLLVGKHMRHELQQQDTLHSLGIDVSSESTLELLAQPSAAEPEEGAHTDKDEESDASSSHLHIGLGGGNSSDDGEDGSFGSPSMSPSLSPPSWSSEEDALPSQRLASPQLPA